MIKRITLFLAVNILVVLTISCILSFLHLQPYLQAYGLDYKALMIFCLVWGMAGAFISLMLSKVTAKWLLGVRVIDANNPSSEYRQLYARVEKLALAANLPKVPEVGVFESTTPNAFATGPTQRRSLVAVSTALLAKMTPSELEAVLGHEISHIKNGDMVTMTLLQGIINAFVMFLARVLAFILSGLGKNQKQGSGGSYASYYVFTFLFEILFMILGSLVIAAYSRRREFRADYGGASLTSRASMVSALQALQKSTLSQRQEEPQQAAALQAFMIHATKKSSIVQLFATHPPLEKRIERLMQAHDLT